MKYLVNIRTKKHHHYDELYFQENKPELRIVEADAAGWIKWDGGECPLPDDCKVECKLEYGAVSAKRSADVFCWSKNVSHFSITAYRPILDKPEDIAKDAGMTASENYENQCKRLGVEPKSFPIGDPRGWEELKPAPDDIISRLKSANEAAQSIPDLLAELREALGSELLRMLADAPVGTEPCCGIPSQCWEPCGDLGKSEDHVKVSEPDMSDWRNWQEGDLVECLEGNGWARFLEGGIYPVTKNTGKSIEVLGSTVTSNVNDFRFHSRPEKTK